jgi:hypothetical protein
MVILLILSPSLRAQSVAYEPAEQVHWAVAAFFGTGWYQVDDNRQAFIFRIPPRQVVREPGWDESGERRYGIEIHYPLAFGLHQLDDLPDFIEFDNYGTVTFTPGVTVEVPVSERWRLRPFAHIGAGYERTSGEWAGIWYGGIRSRYLLGEDNRRSWYLLNDLSYAGYKPEYKQRGQYGTFMAGLEFSHPMPGVDRDQGVQLNWHLTYNYLFDKLNFHVSEEEQVSIEDEWEIGLALGRDSGNVKIWFMEFEQVGLTFKFSSNGEYQAITFNLRSPFTR